MNCFEFERRLKKRQRVWVSLLIVFFVVSITIGGYVGWQGGGVLTSILSAFLGATLVMLPAKAIDDYLQRGLLKEYWIEDCGDVIKLHGAFRIVHYASVCREIHKVRPGYRIIDGAYDQYGCTLAAVPASAEELEAKTELQSLGFRTTAYG